MRRLHGHIWKSIGQECGRFLYVADPHHCFYASVFMSKNRAADADARKPLLRDLAVGRGGREWHAWPNHWMARMVKGRYRCFLCENAPMSRCFPVSEKGAIRTLSSPGRRHWNVAFCWGQGTKVPPMHTQPRPRRHGTGPGMPGPTRIRGRCGTGRTRPVLRPPARSSRL